MKRIYQYLMLTGVSGLLCLFLAIPADAQRGASHGSGGGSRGGGGGGGFSGGGGGRSGGGFSGGGRSNGVFSGRSNGGFSGRSNGAYSGRGGGMRQEGSISSPRLGTQGRNQVFQGNSNRAYSGRGSNVYGGTNRTYSYRGGAYGAPNRTYSYRGGSGYRGNIGRGYYRGGRYYGGRPYYYNRGGYYGRGFYSPWARSRGFYYNRGFYSSLYYPRLGFSLGVLPFGYYSFYWNDIPYYYSDGYYYQQNNNQYTVVEPPVGAAISTLPEKAEPITINGEQFYELNGVYYQPITKDDGTVVYQIAGKDGQLETGNPEDMPGPTIEEPQIGDIVNDLPPDTRKVKLDGQKLFVSPDDFYYQETRDSNGHKAYKVVGTPTDEPGN